MGVSALHPVSPTEYSCKTWTEYMEQLSEDSEKSILAGTLEKKKRQEVGAPPNQWWVYPLFFSYSVLQSEHKTAWNQELVLAGTVRSPGEIFWFPLEEQGRDP